MDKLKLKGNNQITVIPEGVDLFHRILPQIIVNFIVQAQNTTGKRAIQFLDLKFYKFILVVIVDLDIDPITGEIVQVDISFIMDSSKFEQSVRSDLMVYIKTFISDVKKADNDIKNIISANSNLQPEIIEIKCFSHDDIAQII